MSATNFKKCGIVCEYNPLHNGHIRQISAAKKQTGCETLVCLMSGDFTQRGDGAVLDKYLRANHAVKAGADIVLELPVVFATGSAEDFAYGAVKILSALGCDCMHFGSECGDIETLNSIADFFLSPPASFNRKLQENLKKGLSYPQSVAKAVAKYFDNGILDKPNNILAIEYLKEIKKQKSKMMPFTVARNSDYHSDDLLTEFCSASAIRAACSEQEFKKIKRHVPDYVFADLKEKQFFNQRYYEIFAHAHLLTKTAEQLKKIYGADEGLDNRLRKNLCLPTFSDLLFETKSKRYTLVKVKRLILHSVLDITKNSVKLAKKIKPYFKVLAIKSDRTDILSDFSSCPVSDMKNLNDSQKEILSIDIKAANIYNALCCQKGNTDISSQMQKVDV